MSAAAQAIRPKQSAPAPEVRRRHKPEQRAVLTASPRYLRASVRLGGLHDPEEHEAERAASTISAGGCHQVVDPGGATNLRAAEVARTSASHDQVRPAMQPAVVDPGASGRVRRAPAHEAIDPGGIHSLRATMTTAAADKAADGPMDRSVETRATAAPRDLADPGASERVRRTPVPSVVDPGGTASLRATVAMPQVSDPGASGRIRRTADSAASDGAGHVRATPAADTRSLGHSVVAKRNEPHLADDADAEAAQRIEKARVSVGQPLPATVRARLEHGFGVPLANVRVDTSPTARAAAAAIGARAYTEGERITLGHGESEHDLRLMAHETTHVVQNRRRGTIGRPMAAASGEIRRKVRPDSDSDSDSGDGRTYRMLDGRTIELPDDMTAAEAHELEMAGVAAKRHLGQGPPPKPVPDVHKPAEKTAKKVVKPPPKAAHGPHAKHVIGPHSVGVRAHLKPAASKVGQYLVSKAAPVLARGVGKIGNLSLHQQTHDDAGKKVHQAEKAVVIPESDGQSKSNFGQVGVIAARPPPAPDENKAKSELQDSLAQNVPKTIEDVDNFKRDMKAQHSGADVLKVVQTDKNAVVGTFGDMEHTPPPLPPEHLPEELPPPEAAPPTGAMNLGQGAVAPLLPEHTDVSQYTKDADDRLKQEGVTQEQLDMVDSGDLADANKEKKGLEQAAKTEPHAVQNFAKDATAKVDRDLHQEEQAQRGALTAHRRQGLHRTGEHQKTAKSTLEKKRDEVAAKINGIYQTTQDSVKKKLADLETQSMKRFDDGNARASKAFEDNVNRELDTYKDDRYSGVFGWARKAKDWLLGMDELPRVKEIFDTNRETFVQTVNKLVEDISADNKRVVQECKDELAKAKTDIKDYVDKLGPQLKDIANKTAGEVTGKLDELDGFIRKKEEELQQKLADKQQAAIKAIDDKIAKMKEAMSGALAKLGNLLLWAAKKFFTWALEQFGYSLGEIQGIIDKGAAVLKAIFTKPIQFVKNLIAAAKLGFQNFGKNFLTHLKDAIFDWLTGSMEGVTLPTSWDFQGIASVALQILGLTWANIRGKLVKLIGETPVKALESGFDLVVTLVRDGPMAAWEKIKEMGEEIKQAFIEGVKDFIKIKIIQKAIETVISLFVPGAGIVRAIIGIYDTVVFFIQKAKQIMEMIGNFLSSIGDIAAGNVGAAADALEKGLARGLTLVINFLARFLHLDGITAKIRAAIQKLRAKVDGMLDKVAGWIVEKGKKLFASLFGKGHESGKADKQDKRSPEEKERDLDKALAEGDVLIAKNAPANDMQAGLARIKARYGLARLELVIDSKSELTEVVHLHGEINPTRDGKKAEISSGKWKLAPGGLRMHEGTIITSDKGVHLFSKHGGDVALLEFAEELKQSIGAFGKGRQALIDYYHEQIEAVSNAITRASERRARDAEAIAKRDENVMRLVTQLQSNQTLWSYWSNVNPNDREAAVAAMQHPSWRSRAGGGPRAVSELRKTRFMNNKVLETAVMATLEAKAQEIDDGLEHAPDRPLKISHKLGGNLGIGYEMDERRQAVRITASMGWVSVIIRVSEPRRHLYVVETGWPHP